MPPARPATIYLHIGLFKSGTTYLQTVLWGNRRRLAKNGVLVPGRERPDQGRAVRDVLDIDRWGQPDAVKAGAWDRLRAEVSRWSGGSAIFSAENLSIASRDQVRHVVSSLEPNRVEVLVTARDLARAIPASWQTLTRNGRSVGWTEFLDAIADPQRREASPARGFWLKQDLPLVLERWSSAVPPEQIHVVTVPRPGAAPTLLWQRFASAAGLADPARYETSFPRANESIGAPAAELLRRLNPQLREQVPWSVYQPVVTDYLSKKVLAGLSSEPRIGFDYRSTGWVSEKAEEMAELVTAAGYPVTGDISELIPTPACVVEGVSPDAVSDAELLTSAMAIILSLVPRAAETAPQRRKGGGHRTGAGGADRTHGATPAARARRKAAQLARSATKRVK